MNATINIARKSVLAWLTPSPIHTRIPERYARINPAAVNAADIKYPPIQKSIAVMSAGPTSGLFALKIVTAKKHARAMSASFHAPHAYANRAQTVPPDLSGIDRASRRPSRKSLIEMAIQAVKTARLCDKNQIAPTRQPIASQRPIRAMRDFCTVPGACSGNSSQTASPARRSSTSFIWATQATRYFERIRTVFLRTARLILTFRSRK